MARPAHILVLVSLAGVSLAANHAKASPGCTAVNSGNWNVSVTGGVVTRSDVFDAGDVLNFTFSVGDPQFNLWSFDGALAAGGTSAGGTQSSASFTATSGTGSLTVRSNTPVGVPGAIARPIAVTGSSCTPSGTSPQSSANLREVQTSATRLAARASAQALSGIVDTAVNAGFSGNSQPFSFNGQRFTLQSAALHTESRADVMSDDSRLTTRHDWISWLEVRGAGYDSDSSSGASAGDQLNVVAGLTRKLTSDFIVGILGGYERLDYNLDVSAAELSGDGWTIGGYAGWRLSPKLRLDGAISHSGISYRTSAGAVTGSLSARRWLVSGGLTGNLQWPRMSIEPSARMYIVSEQQDGYTDSVGGSNAERSLETGRASGGAKVSTSFTASSNSVRPYLGIYADYYFSRDDAEAGPPPFAPELRRWASRIIAGAAMNLTGRLGVDLGGEYSRIGENTTGWAWHLRGTIPF